MDYEVLKAALEQKHTLLQKLTELARQLEMHSKEADYDAGELTRHRQVYIDRLQKCEALISAQIERLSAEDQARIKRVLSVGGKDDAANAEELALYQYGVDCRTALRSILAADSVSIRRIETERNRLRDLLGQSRGKAGGQMFYRSIH